MTWLRPRWTLSTGRPGWPTILIVTSAATVASAAVPTNLYEWMGTAPIVVVGTVVVDDERFIEIEPSTVLRGAVVVGSRLPVDVRVANRERPAGAPAWKPIAGESYVLLLAPPAADAKGGRAKAYRLVHGIAGARQVSAEGGRAVVEAVTKLVAVQALDNDLLAWQEFHRMLEETNPLLLESALGMYEKFSRAGPDEIPIVLPLLDHPRVELRAAAARVLGRIARAGREIPEEQSTEIVGALTARARRDEVVAVRVAATAALAGFPAPSVEELLRQIARDDPDQAVRFEAHTGLYERGTSEASRSRTN